MYEIGQIIYGLIDDKQALVPLKIIEEITIKNIHKQKTNYKVLLPNEKQQKVDLEKFDNVFENTDKASAFLLENAKKAIDNIIHKAISVEEKFFVKENKTLDDNVKCNNENKNIKIDLGNGLIGNIKEDVLDNKDIEKNNQEEVKIEKNSIT